MKRFRTYISSRGSSKDEERPEKNSRHPSALPVRNNNFKFPSTQALAAANAAAHPFEPLYPSLNPHSLRINAKSPGAGDQVPSSHSSSSSPSRTQTKIRKPAPRYSGSSIIVPVPFPSSEPTTASTPTLDTHRLDSRPNRSHGRSKSVRIVVPEDAVFGTVTRSRSLSSPNTNKASRFGVARHSSFAGGTVSNGLHWLSPRQASPLEVVPEHGDNESAPEHHDHAHEISFSDSQAGHSEDGGKSSEGGDIEDLDENDDNFETATTETQSVESNRESIRLDILDDLATFDDHSPNNSSARPQDHPVSLVSSQSNIWRPLNIRPRPSATPLVPLSLDGRNLGESRIHSCIEDDSIVTAPQAVSVEGYLHTPESSFDSTASLEDAKNKSHLRHRHSHSYPASTQPRSSYLAGAPVDDSFSAHANYTPLLEGMSSVIALGGTEYLINMESRLGGYEAHGTTNVRVQVVGGGPRRFYPDAYVVMVIEGEECLVRVVRELGGDESLRTPIRASFVESESQDDANPYCISWRPGMHITVTLAGITFLVVQVERLRCLSTTPSNNEQDASHSDNSDNFSLVQIASVSAGWWTFPEAGRHVVLILGSENRRQEYLVRVVRRLTTTAPEFSPRPPCHGAGPVSMDHKMNLENSDKRTSALRNYSPRSPRHSIQAMAPVSAALDTLLSTPSPTLPPPSQSSVLVLARGYRYLTVASDGSLRFELLLEDRTNDLYASYMEENGFTPRTWVVSGGQSHRDASWVFKKDGKPIVNPDIDEQAQLEGNRRVAGSENSSSADLPHHFLFEREAPSDAWVFKPAFGSSGIHSQYASSSSDFPVHDLDELLLDGGSTFRNGSGVTIFVSRLVLRKDRDIVIFHLSPASKEQVRELSRRVRIKRQEMEAERQGRQGLADGLTDGLTDGQESSHTNAQPSLRSASEDLLRPSQDLTEVPRQSISDSSTIDEREVERGSSLRTLRYGSHGELMFAPWDSSQPRAPMDLQLSSSSPQTFPSPPGTFSGEFLVYSHPDSGSDEPRQSYVFYPADHSDLEQDLNVDIAGLPNTMLKFTFKILCESDTWMFVPAGDDEHANIDGLPLTTRLPTGTRSIAGVLFRASIDDTGKITLVRLPLKSSLKAGLRASISGIPRSTWGNKHHSSSGSIGSVKSESHVPKHGRPRSEQLSMKGFKFANFTQSIGDSFKSLVAENRPASADADSRSALRSKRTSSFAL